MDSKWPFMLITFGLIFVLGLTIAGLEKNGVMNNWDSRRCELPVTVAAMFFKPDSDPRTGSDFAKDNFNFCMKSYIDKFMNILMSPINALFGKHAGLAGSAIDIVNTVRKIASSMYAAFSTYIDKFYKQFSSSIYEISRIIQYLRMAFRRANAVVMSMLYSGISIFRGLLNTIQFIVKVILIICGIMLAIMFILIFILFPFIPMILAVLGAIISTILALSMVVGGSVANEAMNDKSGFCFSESTQIIVKEKGKYVSKSVKDIKMGDELGYNGGIITAIIEMSGKNVQLYNINGIIVSGSHLVLGTDSLWKSVSVDERAKKIDGNSSILYCFNTTSHNIPAISPKNNDCIMFRDWEEFNDNDSLGQYMWNYNILKMLNNNANYNIWKKGLKLDTEIPLIGRNIKIKTTIGFIEISNIIELWNKSRDDNSKSNNTIYILDRYGNTQDILGIVYAELDNIDDSTGIWNTELYEWLDEGIWIKGSSTVSRSKNNGIGMTIISKTGEFIIWDNIHKKEKIIRDFTEIGYKEIHKTYPLVCSRLRLEII